MTSLKTLITSKTGIAAIAGVLTLSVIAGTTGYIFANKDIKDSDKQAQATVTPTATLQPTMTATPTTEPTAAPTQAPQVTQAPVATATPVVVTTKTYTDNDIKASFTYPSNYTLTAGTFTPHSSTQIASKKIEIKSDKGNTLVMEFSTSATGCYKPADYKETVDNLLINTASGRNISRYKTTTQSGQATGIQYGEYSSSQNGQGASCDLIILTDKTYPEFGGDTKGYFFIKVSSLSVSNQELDGFDSIVKSMKRL
jgi:hypothetical protein